MELARRHSERPRCPYCHDQLEDTTELVTCAACGTQHHSACADELGRCTVLGCETPLTPTGVARGDEAAIRQRIRQRIGRVVSTVRPPSLPENNYAAARLQAAIRDVMQGDHRPETAKLREIRRIEVELDPDVVDIVWASLEVDRAAMLKRDPVLDEVARMMGKLLVGILVVAGLSLWITSLLSS